MTFPFENEKLTDAEFNALVREEFKAGIRRRNQRRKQKIFYTLVLLAGVLLTVLIYITRKGR